MASGRSAGRGWERFGDQHQMRDAMIDMATTRPLPNIFNGGRGYDDCRPRSCKKPQTLNPKPSRHYKIELHPICLSRSLFSAFLFCLRVTFVHPWLNPGHGVVVMTPGSNPCDPGECVFAPCVFDPLFSGRFLRSGFETLRDFLCVFRVFRFKAKTFFHLGRLQPVTASFPFH